MLSNSGDYRAHAISLGLTPQVRPLLLLDEGRLMFWMTMGQIHCKISTNISEISSNPSNPITSNAQQSKLSCPRAGWPLHVCCFPWGRRHPGHRDTQGWGKSFWSAELLHEVWGRLSSRGADLGEQEQLQQKLVAWLPGLPSHLQCAAFWGRSKALWSISAHFCVEISGWHLKASTNWASRVGHCLTKAKKKIAESRMLPGGSSRAGCRLPD